MIERHDPRRALDALVGILADERVAMERVCQRATATALLARAGQARFLPAATDELEDSLDRLRTIEVMRALVVAELAELWGVPDSELPLAEIALRSGPEHTQILEHHLHSLRRLTSKLDDLVDNAKQVVAEQLTGISSGLENMAAQVGINSYWASSDSMLG